MIIVDYILKNLSIVEVLWIIISGVGLLFSLKNLSAAKDDVKNATEIVNYRRATRILIAAGANLRSKIRTSVFAGWLLLGVVFGFFEVPRVAGVTGLFVLIVGAAGFAYNALQESGERKEAAKLLAEDIAANELSVHDAEIADASSHVDANRAHFLAEQNVDGEQ